MNKTKITCCRCHKNITNNYCTLRYKILTENNEQITMKIGHFCRKCLAKEEDKISAAKRVYYVSESINLYKRPKKANRKKS